MPIIDSRSDSKFDALIRTNKADSLMSFIMATYNVKKTENRKLEVANRLKSAYELFRQNIKGSRLVEVVQKYNTDINKIQYTSLVTSKGIDYIIQLLRKLNYIENIDK